MRFDRQAQQLSFWLRTQTLPHALMWQGALSDFDNLQTRTKRALLCQQPLEAEQKACEVCVSCRLENHPDCLIVRPLKNTFKIEQIRALIAFLHWQSHTSPHRLVIVEHAQFLNDQASNALLKIIEEPPNDSFLWLGVDAKAQLLPTLKSRLVSIDFHETHTNSWARFQQDHRTLVACLSQYLPNWWLEGQGLLSFSHELSQYPIELVFQALGNLWHEACKRKHNEHSELPAWAEFSQTLAPSALFEIWDKTLLAQKACAGTQNFNAALALEALFIEYWRLSQKYAKV